MAVELHIDDGNPWYLSPDIWTVPGNPNGNPGIPVLNQPAYVWARVHNRGNTPVTNATVVYYWANPSTLITRKTATRIGSSNVSLAAGDVKEVLCLTPWLPTWVNDGHLCLIAETFAPADSLPPHNEDDPIVPVDDRHVAQLNLNIALALRQTRWIVHPFATANAARLHTETITLRAYRAPVELLASVSAYLGLERLPEELDDVDQIALQPYRCGEEISDEGRPDIQVQLKPGEQKSMALIVKLPPERRPHAGALFLVEQIIREQIVGGLGVLVLSQDQ